ncbi:MAG: hypothetical protein KDE51_10320 [Anaerolineales bacterium]|nr:hypothetical protein [Anaerolineales bacterium]
MSDNPTYVLPYTSRLHRMMVELLSLEEFKTLCFDLRFDFEALESRGKPNQMRELIDFMQRNNRLPDVVSLCKDIMPDEPWDRQKDEPLHSTLAVVLPRGDTSKSVERGLAALSDLMQLPEARTAVIVFRNDFEAVIDQIDILADYKQVHDLLHSLEYQCFNILQQASRLFPDDDFALDSLIEAELTLQQIVGALHELNTRSSFATNELVWVQDLERVQGHLTGAMDDEDEKQLRRAIWLINRIIAIQPSQINTRLNAVARTLRLSVLARAMTSIYETLGKLNMDKDKLDQFVQGAYALSQLNVNLDKMVEGHDDWQAIILELRRIDNSLESDPLELEMSWPDLRPMIEALYEGVEEEWATTLDEDVERLGEAVAGANPARMKRFFRRLERRASDRFYRIDIDLRRLCEDLRRVGEPLATVLSILD